MIADLIWTRPALKIIIEMLKGGQFAYYSANELARRTGLSVPTVIESINGLIALGIIERVQATAKRQYFRLRDLNPVTPLIEELIEILDALEEKISEKPLTHIDLILNEEYYVGMYWAAMSNITPIDYAPRIYAIYTRKPQWVLPLKASSKLYVETISKWYPQKNREAFLAVIPTNEYPPDLTWGEVQGMQVRVASIERGIAQTFKSIIYPPYAATLALLQNKDLGRLDEEKLEKIAREEGTLTILKAVSYLAEKILKQDIFETLSKNVREDKGKPKKTWGKKPTIILNVEGETIGIDPQPIEEAITTIYG